jgi:hypothetical protein
VLKKRKSKRDAASVVTLAAESERSKAERLARLLAHPCAPPHHNADGLLTPAEVRVLREQFAFLRMHYNEPDGRSRIDLHLRRLKQFPEIQSWGVGLASIRVGCIPLKLEDGTVVKPDLAAIWQRLHSFLAQLDPPIHARRADFDLVEEKPRWAVLEGAQDNLGDAMAAETGDHVPQRTPCTENHDD